MAEKQGSVNGDLYSLDAHKVYRLNSPTRTHHLEHEGWVRECTVEPRYNGQSWGHIKVALIKRWSF